MEYVLGPALEEMHFSWERYWRELAIALPRPIGLPRFDQTSDVTQVAAVSLALLLGRPLAGDEYPHKITDVLDSATARQADGAAPLPAALRTWLRRALHIEPRAAFASAIEAQAELDRVLDLDDASGRAALKAFLSRYASAIALERHAAQAKPGPAAPVEPVKTAPAVEIVEAVVPSAVVTPFTPVEPAPAVVPPPVPELAPVEDDAPAAPSDPFRTFAPPVAALDAPAPVEPLFASSLATAPAHVEDDADQESELRAHAAVHGDTVPRAGAVRAARAAVARPAIGHAVHPRAAAAELRVPELEPEPLAAPRAETARQPERMPVLTNGFETGRLEAQADVDAGDEDEPARVEPGWPPPRRNMAGRCGRARGPSPASSC